MAEFVNQRVEDMINELEQMQRLCLYSPDEIREISRKRKDFEYRIQRSNKQKEDYVHYIAYEMALLEDISLRRKKMNLNVKKNEIEYAIAKRLNRLFKQFIYRFQNDIEVYFQYIKFCISVGFDHAVSGIIGQMLQMHGDKPKTWQLAGKWEYKEQKNVDNAREFLLKGITRHPESDILYLDLFKIELLLAFQADTEEIKEKQLKRADVVWRNGIKIIEDLSFLFRLCDISVTFEVAESITKNLKAELWSKRNHQDVWCYIALNELQGHHWEEIEEFVEIEDELPNVVNNFVCIYEEALHKFSDEKLSTKYIYELLSLSESICPTMTKIKLVKRAWLFCHENGVLSANMYAFGIQFLQIENEMTTVELMEILDTACKKNPKAKCLWEQKLILIKDDDKEMQSILLETKKHLSTDDQVDLWCKVLDIVESSTMIKSLYTMFQNCESSILLLLKPKLLEKIFQHSGLKAARDIYEEFIKTPPIQLEVQKIMLDIEKSQEKFNVTQVKKCYELMVQHHGQHNFDIWLDYINFESEYGSAALVPSIYRRAVATLDKILVDEFIKAHTLARLK